MFFIRKLQLLALIVLYFSCGTFAIDCHEEIHPDYLEVDVPSLIHINGINDADAVRANIIHYLWRDEGFPSEKMPVSVKWLSKKGESIKYDSGETIYPKKIGGLALWLDANDGAKISIEESKLCQWRDKSGNENHATQKKDEFAPVYSRSTVNGKAAVCFDGVNDFMDVLDDTSLDIENTTIFLVVKVISADNAGDPYPLTKMPISKGYRFAIGEDNTPLFRITRKSKMWTARSTDVVSDEFEIWSGRFDGNALEFYTNSNLKNSIGIPGSIDKTDGNLRIGGAEDNGRNSFNGYIAEILIYNSAISPFQREQVEQYLGSKYNIQKDIYTFPAWIKNIGSDNIGEVEKMDIQMDFGMHSYAYHIRPKANSVNSLLIFHQGHSDNILSYGGKETIRYFLDKGYSILAFWMPFCGENDRPIDIPNRGIVRLAGRPASKHNQMAKMLESEEGSFISFFLEPVVVGINYVITNYDYLSINMTGISGGGWTTHLCAAIDPRIELSFPVAGSLPLYLRKGPCPNGSQGDAEQKWPALYQDTASWLDIYVLGGYGVMRGQTHILNQYDSCCFGGINYRTFEPDVSNIVEKLGSGFYCVYLDSTHREHQISESALNIIYSKITNNMSIKKHHMAKEK